jgi:HlyD family secretion protein
MKRRRQIIVLVITVLVLGTGAGLLFRPAAIPVEAVSIGRGELLESVEEEGKTRMHDHFSVAAPVAGMLRRIDLHAGDRVRAGQRLAWIDPAPIDPREKAVLDARLNAARATHRQAEAQASRSKADYVQAELDLNRNRQLFRDGIISKEMLERQITLHDTAAKQLQAAQSAVDAAGFQVEEARSALLLNKDRPSDMPTPIRSPVGGRVLRLFEQSERVVVTGTPLLEIGYMPRLEVVTDFLTRDAVRIQPGMPALLIDWGGDAEIPAHVREVEPGGFTKISALGVEEQRVNVVCDLDAPANGLQDGYHANVRVITWRDKDVLQVPSSAVYRSAGEWKVFIVQEGRAVRRTVRIGHRGDASWEILGGLEAGDRVIIHPSTEIDEGRKVKLVASAKSDNNLLYARPGSQSRSSVAFRAFG